MDKKEKEEWEAIYEKTLQEIKITKTELFSENHPN
jgi:hypothetical protein